MPIWVLPILGILKPFWIYRTPSSMPILRGEVSHPICMSHASSNASATVFILRPNRSRLLTLWWLALHLLLLAAVVGLGVPHAFKAALAAALVAHGLLRWPRPETRVLQRQADGRWALPDHGRSDLSLAAGTSYTALWVRLVLAGDGETFDIVLLKDQFDQISWRALQTRLRSGGSGGIVPS